MKKRRARAYIVSDLRERRTAIACQKCGRMGHYRREMLVRRYGPDVALPDMLVRFANSPRYRNFGDKCGAGYGEPLECL